MSKEDNPDYAGPEGNRLRAEAQKYADERHEFLDASKNAFEAGDKAKAKELSEKGKAAGRKMEECNKKAAKAILKHRNAGYGDHYLDLHGLYLEEALTAFREKLIVLQKSKEEIVFEVIPGAGHHSKNKAVIKPKIIEELTANKSVSFEEKNAGSIYVFINKGKGSSISPPRPVYKDISPPAPSPSNKRKSADSDDAVEKPPSKMCCIIM